MLTAAVLSVLIVITHWWTSIYMLLAARFQWIYEVQEYLIGSTLQMLIIGTLAVAVYRYDYSGKYLAERLSAKTGRTAAEETGAEALGKVVDALHPTPAVCGLPKAEAMLFIARHEGIRRDYYSGFAGPVGINGETHLYVSLRCARLEGRTMTFFAGGGIMPESRCEEEWMETEAKIKTIAHVLQYP